MTHVAPLNISMTHHGNKLLHSWLRHRNYEASLQKPQGAVYLQKNQTLS